MKHFQFNQKVYTRKSLREYIEYIGMYTLGLEKCLEMASFSNDKGAKRLILNLWEKYHNTLNAPYNKEIFSGRLDRSF